MTDNHRILVVDDIGEYAMALEMYFPDGTETLSATTVTDAKKCFDNGKTIDLAIIDVRLNGDQAGDTSGMDLLSWIKKHYPQTKVIMISAYQTFEYEIQAMERGAVRFLKKPLQPSEVKAALQEALKR
ncbi:MAG: response regulator [Victivallales bacterium]|nr:response regulator [Victivallales bacterium]